MKKLLILSMGFILSFNNIGAQTKDTLNLTQVYGDVKSLYKDDLKDIIKYTVNKTDTVLSTGFRILSKGASHTYDILKYQQLVKSFHHLFYWILSIFFAFVVYKRLKIYQGNNIESNAALLGVAIAIDILLFIYNGIYFNEMLTGFLNPEYGAIKEILQHLY